MTVSSFSKIITEEQREQAIKLAEKIDMGEQELFQNSFHETSDSKTISRLIYNSDDHKGLFYACISEGELHIAISFEPDIPDALTEDMNKLIYDIKLKNRELCEVWVAGDNLKLIKNLSDVFNVTPSVSCYEMIIPKAQWHMRNSECTDLLCKTYEPEEAYKYAEMLQRSLAHVCCEGEFVDHVEEHSKQWKKINLEGGFNAWYKNNFLVGISIIVENEIDFIAVSEEFQQKGIGQYILNSSLYKIFEQGYDFAYLYVVSNNTKAIKFYEKNGMKSNAFSTAFKL